MPEDVGDARGMPVSAALGRDAFVVQPLGDVEVGRGSGCLSGSICNSNALGFYAEEKPWPKLYHMGHLNLRHPYKKPWSSIGNPYSRL